MLQNVIDCFLRDSIVTVSNVLLTNSQIFSLRIGHDHDII